MIFDEQEDYRDSLGTTVHALAPTKEQIELIKDTPSLVSILDEVENSIIGIKAHLKYSNNDDPSWRKAAIGALIHNKIAEKNLKKRIVSLRQGKE